MAVHRPARPFANVSLQDAPAAVARLGGGEAQSLALKADRCIIRHSLVSYSRRGRVRTGGWLQPVAGLHLYIAQTGEASSAKNPSVSKVKSVTYWLGNDAVGGVKAAV